MRIFIAIRFTEAFRSSILDVQDGLKEYGVRGNYTQPENLHLTLAFIGETERMEEIKAAVDAVKFEPFVIRTGKMGCFNGRSRVVWLGIEGEDKVKAIAQQLRRNLDQRGIDYAKGKFSPHITLVRQPSEKPLDIDVESESMTVSKIYVMKSERINGRLVYTAL
ncbi:MAG: RNA 2',3'-cyclic phosphodiesterase [Prevotella sp.]|uniref:RNA 2',3'-cyclic phosphodiesterase n=1 Tax=Prevotella sp. TaxID=59823 RepID=UPI00257EAA6D|nr:RNA 2',3'-cyclic phosphodiesterase [Prevotella sp.]MBS5876582.1 RNA 2',3'-cyclic phosphodiesterase [Prevotella sp.]